jgi:hypothetical protein
LITPQILDCFLDWMKAPKRVPRGTLCTYCGEPATSWDHHVRPFSYDNSNQFQRGLAYAQDEVVPACKACNSTLSDTYLSGIVPRAQHLRQRIRERHGQILLTPEWTGDDYREISGGLAAYVREKQGEKIILKCRLIHLSLVIGDVCSQVYELEWLLLRLERKDASTAERIRGLVCNRIPALKELHESRLSIPPEALGSVPTTTSRREG